jgi:DNA polymerase
MSDQGSMPARWDERQRAMLEAMGLRVWVRRAGSPDVAAGAAAGASAQAAAAAVQPVAAATRAAAPPQAAPVRPAQVAVSAPRGSADHDVASLDWPALREAVAACRACGLCEGRKNTVFGVGNEQAHWMIVGEAPGEQEDLQGEPFVGTAGKLLDNMLRAIGLGRQAGPPEQQVFIANTLKCRPPRNRNPEPEELARCAPFLERQIELVKPRVILAMGRFAVQSLLGSNEAIGRLRGRVHDFRGIPLIVTYHPAYLLRNPADKARAWDDLCLAMDVLSAAQPQQGRTPG